MSGLHPDIKMPIWAAVAIAAAAYLVRSVARGMDFAPDLPSDAVVLGLLAIVIIAVWISRRSQPMDKCDDSLEEKMEHEDD